MSRLELTIEPLNKRNAGSINKTPIVLRCITDIYPKTELNILVNHIYRHTQ